MRWTGRLLGRKMLQQRFDGNVALGNLAEVELIGGEVLPQ